MERIKYLINSVLIIACFSCSNPDDKLCLYIEEHCKLNTNDSCYINLKNALNVDYDTMYLFPGYPVPKEVFSFVLKMPYSKNKEHSDGDRVILIKDGKIVYEDEWSHEKVTISGGTEFTDITDDKVTFDGDKLPFSYVVYVNSVFKVSRIENPTGHLNKYFYELINTQSPETSDRR